MSNQQLGRGQTTLLTLATTTGAVPGGNIFIGTAGTQKFEFAAKFPDGTPHFGFGDVYHTNHWPILSDGRQGTPGPFEGVTTPGSPSNDLSLTSPLYFGYYYDGLNSVGQIVPYHAPAPGLTTYYAMPAGWGFANQDGGDLALGAAYTPNPGYVNRLPVTQLVTVPPDAELGTYLASFFMNVYEGTDGSHITAAHTVGFLVPFDVVENGLEPTDVIVTTGGIDASCGGSGCVNVIQWQPVT